MSLQVIRYFANPIRRAQASVRRYQVLSQPHSEPHIRGSEPVTGQSAEKAAKRGPFAPCIRQQRTTKLIGCSALHGIWSKGGDMERAEVVDECLQGYLSIIALLL